MGVVGAVGSSGAWRQPCEINVLGMEWNLGSWFSQSGGTTELLSMYMLGDLPIAVIMNIHCNTPMNAPMLQPPAYAIDDH